MSEKVKSLGEIAYPISDNYRTSEVTDIFAAVHAVEDKLCLLLEVYADVPDAFARDLLEAGVINIPAFILFYDTLGEGK